MSLAPDIWFVDGLGLAREGRQCDDKIIRRHGVWQPEPQTTARCRFIW